jgi:SlyX protein
VSDEERLVDIEIKLSQQEDLVEELNKLVYLQQKKIDQLDQLCEALLRHVRELSDTVAERSAANEKPPHY